VGAGTGLVVRRATVEDAVACQVIYAPYVRDTVISFEVEPPSVEEMARRIEATIPMFPWLVHVEDGRIAGYAYAGRHKERLAYQWSVDVSAYVHRDFHRRGIGGSLYRSLLALLRRQGFVNAYGGITLPNAALVVVMIETVEGLANIEEIAKVEGVDVIHVGANDLLTAMGKPGKFGDPEIMAAIERVITVSRQHGKFAGVGGDRHVERQAGFIRQGARFMTTQTDIGFLIAEASRVTGELRKALG